MADEPELLTPQEAARRLRVSEETVRRWLRLRKIRGVQLVGGRWRIPASEIDDMLKGIRQIELPEPTHQKKAAA